MHPKAAEYTFFSSAHRTFSRTDHMLGHKKKSSIHLRRLKSYQACIFSDHSGMKLEINYRKETGKHTNMWRLNNILLKNQWVNKEIKEEIKKNTWRKGEFVVRLRAFLTCAC